MPRNEKPRYTGSGWPARRLIPKAADHPINKVTPSTPNDAEASSQTEWVPENGIRYFERHGHKIRPSDWDYNRASNSWRAMCANCGRICIVYAKGAVDIVGDAKCIAIVKE